TAVLLGAVGDVDGGHRHRGAQRLGDRVAAGDPLGVAPAGTATRGRTRALLGPGPLLVGLVVRPVLGLGGRALALETALHPPAGAGGGVALAALADRAASCGVACHVMSLGRW